MSLPETAPSARIPDREAWLGAPGREDWYILPRKGNGAPAKLVPVIRFRFHTAARTGSGGSGRNAPQMAIARRRTETTAFQPAKERNRNRQLASVQLTTWMFLSWFNKSAADLVVPVPPPQSVGFRLSGRDFHPHPNEILTSRSNT